MQGLGFMDLERGLSELSKYIWITEFGQVELSQIIFELEPNHRFNLNRKSYLKIKRGGGKGVGPAQLAQCAVGSIKQKLICLN